MAKKKAKSKSAKAKESIPTPQNESNVDESIVAVLNTKVNPPPILIKVCRLCETRDGPFLNIFDADKITAKKIDGLMPFTIEENDDMPHNICFRCSAKLEELYEFLQKCVKTQENLRTAVGKTGPLILKSKSRAMWEEKLNKKNLSNEEICDELIKRAMEGIKDLPPNILLPPEEDKPPTPPPPPQTTAKKAKTQAKKIQILSSSDDEQDEQTLKQVKLTIEKCNEKLPPRSSRSNKTATLLENVTILNKKTKPAKRTDNIEQDNKEDNANNRIINFSMDYYGDVPENKKEAPPKVTPNETPKEPPPKTKAFNIMDHVCTIKVNGVGILFQCKLCNRNFLKKDVVESHGCAKNNVPKDITQNNAPLPEPPKPPTVKYITIDKDFKKKANECKNKSVERQPVEQIVPEKVVPSQPVQLVSVKPDLVEPPVKPRPKAGPASKMKQLEQKLPLKEPQRTEPKPTTNTSQEVKSNAVNLPTVNFPLIPSLNSQYKLIPGPNNTFTLIEDPSQKEKISEAEPPPKPIRQPRMKKRMVTPSPEREDGESSSEIITLGGEQPSTRPKGQPYPVGLFQTVPHSSNRIPSQFDPSFVQLQFSPAPFVQSQFSPAPFVQPQFSPASFAQPQFTPAPFAPPTNPTRAALPHPPTFTTPAMKKQSYTIVQTGNPSKLLISTKPQPAVPPEEPVKKKFKKKYDTNEEVVPDKSRQFFTFVNVDSESQPSYVLPTDNIIQESQISTSTQVTKLVDDKDYTCNMCNEKFSREKKLLTHIQSHYNMMDAEDERRTSAPKKRSRKS